MMAAELFEMCIIKTLDADRKAIDADRAIGRRFFLSNVPCLLPALFQYQQQREECLDALQQFFKTRRRNKLGVPPRKNRLQRAARDIDCPATGRQQGSI